MLAIYKKLVYNVFVIIKLKHYDRNTVSRCAFSYSERDGSS